MKQEINLQVMQILHDLIKAHHRRLNTPFSDTSIRYSTPVTEKLMRALEEYSGRVNGLFATVTYIELAPNLLSTLNDNWINVDYDEIGVRLNVISHYLLDVHLNHVSMTTAFRTELNEIDVLARQLHGLIEHTLETYHASIIIKHLVGDIKNTVTPCKGQSSETYINNLTIYLMAQCGQMTLREVWNTYANIILVTDARIKVLIERNKHQHDVILGD